MNSDRCNPDPEEHSSSMTNTAFVSKIKKFISPGWLFLVILVIIMVLQTIIYFAPRDVKEFLTFKPKQKEDLWRYISYALVHEGNEHLLINLILQSYVGLIMVNDCKWTMVLCSYPCGICSAPFAILAFNTGFGLVGSSAGIFSMISSQIFTINICLEEKVMERTLLYYYKIVSKTALVLFIILYLSFDWNITHFIGGIVGLLIGVINRIWTKCIKRQQKPNDNVQ